MVFELLGIGTNNQDLAAGMETWIYRRL